MGVWERSGQAPAKAESVFWRRGSAAATIYAYGRLGRPESSVGSLGDGTPDRAPRLAPSAGSGVSVPQRTGDLLHLRTGLCLLQRPGFQEHVVNFLTTRGLMMHGA